MREELQAQVDALETTDVFPSRQALWRALAQVPWAKERGLTARALETRARRLGVEPRSPRGTGHRFPGRRPPAGQEAGNGSGSRLPSGSAQAPHDAGTSTQPEVPPPGPDEADPGSAQAPQGDGGVPAPQRDLVAGWPEGRPGDLARAGAGPHAAPQRLSLPVLRQQTPARHHRLVERVGSGSLRAAINLKCLECSLYQVAEVRDCAITACPLHSLRPYQP